MSTPAPEQQTSRPVRADLLVAVRTWYETHPGYHRPMDVAKSMSEDEPTTTHQVATTSARLHGRGVIRRVRSTPKGWNRQVTRYGISQHQTETVSPEE